MEKIHVFVGHRNERLVHQLQHEVLSHPGLAWAGRGITGSQLQAISEASTRLAVLIDPTIEDFSVQSLKPHFRRQSHIRYLYIADAPTIDLVREMLRAGASGCVVQNESLRFLLESLPSVFRSQIVLSSSLVPQLLSD